MGSCCNKIEFAKIATVDLAKTTIRDSGPKFIKENLKRFEEVYKVCEKIGNGAYGQVRRVVHKETGIERAAKIFRKDEFVSLDEQNGIRLEIQILRDLDHPNIIKIQEYFEEERKLYIVMEKCEGGDLFDQICKQTTFDEINVAIIIKQILSAVSYLHHHKIAHRDIKPENILFEESQNLINVKLVDFGLASITTPEKQMTELLGSLYYLAPEVIQGCYTEKCDIWSIGIITFTLLTGSFPFISFNDLDIIDKILKKEIDYSAETWQGVSKVAQDFVKKLLCSESCRLSATQALEHHWITSADEQSPERELQNSTLNKLKQFQKQNKLKEVTRSFIVSQCTTLKETKDLRQIFKNIDKNSDGFISKSELINNYKAYFKEEKSNEEISEIFEQVEGGNSEKISYFNFLKVCLNDSAMKNMKHLKLAFNQFDLDGNGKLSIDEIRSVLNDNLEYEEELLEQIIEEADKNGDGHIDFEEFSQMFLKNS